LKRNTTGDVNDRVPVFFQGASIAAKTGAKARPWGVLRGLHLVAKAMKKAAWASPDGFRVRTFCALGSN
jgi:hypothetical protein